MWEVFVSATTSHIICELGLQIRKLNLIFFPSSFLVFATLGRAPFKIGRSGTSLNMHNPTAHMHCQSPIPCSGSPSCLHEHPKVSFQGLSISLNSQTACNSSEQDLFLHIKEIFPNSSFVQM